jgi:glycosyltransferase involved in cell wall biosynthesis
MRNLRSEKEIMAQWQRDPSQPLVSICCITYNHEPYIEDALEGFLIQETNFPFEILIHDDASTDQTADIIREYEARYPTLIKPIYQTENQYSQCNKPGRINRKRAKGEYIALCEGDDYWTDPLKLQIQVDFLEKHPDYVITFHPCVSFDKRGINKKNLSAAKRKLSKEELRKAHPIHTRTVCFRNCIHNFPPEKSTARVGDLFMWSLLSEFGKGKFLKNIKPAYYRIHENGIFSSVNSSVRLDMLMSTKMALFCYYRRKGDIETSQYFATWILLNLIKVVWGKNFFISIYQYCRKYLLSKLPNQLNGNSK